MKYLKGISLGIVVILVAGVALHFIFPRNNSPIRAKVSTRASELTNGTISFRLPESEDPEAVKAWNDKAEKQQWTNDSGVLSYLDGRRRDGFYDWKQPINFWGIVLEDENKPVSGANVSLMWSDLSDAGTSETSILSDEDGRFELLGKTGKGLSVMVKKDGFRRCRWGSISFEYADPSDRAFHRPDSNRPVVFRLIRKGPPEPLVHRDRTQEFRASEDPGMVAFDLLGQREVPPGDSAADLVIRTSHGPVRGERSQRWFDWRVELSVPEGGIQAGSECPPAAPEDGYQPRLVFEGRVEGRNTLSGVSEWFFVKSRAGSLFSRVHLKVAALPIGGGNAKISLLEYSTNPSGSRNLEVYPELQVNEKYYVPRNRIPPP